MSIRRDETFFEEVVTPFSPSDLNQGPASPAKATEDRSLVSDGNVVSGENEAKILAKLNILTYLCGVSPSPDE